MNRIFATCAFLLLSLGAFAQAWEEIRDSEEYIYGEGWGPTVAEADKQALATLISMIATNVSSLSQRTLEVNSSGSDVSEQSQFQNSVQTYSQATLTNTKQIVLQKGPEAHVVRWMKASELDKMFDQRKRKALDLVETAERAEEKGEADVVLRNCYWALTLLKSLQYPNEVTYRDGNGREHVLTNYLKEKMDETLSQLKASCVGQDGNDVRLLITYKDKPVSSVDYTYFDGQSWSAIYSAKDGCGIMELAPGYTDAQVQLQFEYEYKGEAKSYPEVEAVLNVVTKTPMRRATANVRLEPQKKEKSQKAKKGEVVATNTFTTNSIEILQPPTAMGKEAKNYMPVVERVVAAIKQKNYQSVRDCFTDKGWDMFRKLVEYGRAKVLDSKDIRFFEDNGSVVERGLRMSFSFAKGVKKLFVEDVVLTFDGTQKIDNIAFGLGKTAEDDILNKGVWDQQSRFAIMNFLENYKTAYALKRLDYIESVFDDDAVIITGTVIHRASRSVNVENQSTISQEGNLIIKKNRQTKDEYLKNLKRCFERNEFVNIRFASNDVMKMGQGGESYAIQIEQDYYSSTYGDKGYLMLMVDINEPTKPLIKLRTWQPEKDPEFGLYGPGDF